MQYALVHHYWRGSPTVDISLAGTEVHLRIPIEFLQRGGDNTWGFVFRLLEHVVEEGGIISSVGENGRKGSPVDLAVAPVAGPYTFCPNPGTSLTLSRGPESKRPFRAPKPSGSDSTMSNSKGSSSQQNDFRISLIARDGNCLLTGRHYTACTAAHLVPISRPDVYQQLLGDQAASFMFQPWMGILVEDGYHHLYDRYSWSLYHKNGSYYVHFFTPRAEDYHLHGKEISASRFRSAPSDFPDPAFCEWHYKQCVQAHIRGFAVGMSVDAQ